MGWECPLNSFGCQQQKGVWGLGVSVYPSTSSTAKRSFRVGGLWAAGNGGAPTWCWCGDACNQFCPSSSCCRKGLYFSLRVPIGPPDDWRYGWLGSPADFAGFDAEKKAEGGTTLRVAGLAAGLGLVLRLSLCRTLTVQMIQVISCHDIHQIQAKYLLMRTVKSSFLMLLILMDESDEMLNFDSGASVDLSSINFSFKNLSQLASMNYDVLLQSGRNSKCSSPSYEK